MILKATKKFKVWDLCPLSRRRDNSIVLQASQKYTVIDVVKISYETVNIISEITEFANECVSEAALPVVLNLPPVQDYSPIEFCRAALFARILSLRGGRGIRWETFQFLVKCLNEGVVPRFSSQDLSGAQLLDFFIGSESCCCYLGDGVVRCKDAFNLMGVSAISLTPTEVSALSKGSFYSVGVSCLLSGLASNLVNSADGVAALSCEAAQVNVTPFDAVNFDIHRQQRGQINSSSNLRALLESSKRVSSTGEIKEAFRIIPQVHGPALDLVAASVKCLEIELNSIDGSDTFTWHQSVASIASIVTSLNGLVETSYQRTQAIGSDVQNAIPLFQKSTETFSSAFESVSRLHNQLAMELSSALSVLGAGAGAKIASFEETDEAVEVDNTDSKVPGGKKVVIDDSKLTAKQLLAVEAKRKQKAEKAALKAAQKLAKKGEAGIRGGCVVLSLGVGSEMFRTSISSSQSSPEINLSFEQAVSFLNPSNFSVTGSSAVLSRILEKLNSGGKRKPKIAKGARDFTPEQMRVREQAFASIRRVFKRHGGVEIDTPVFELKEILTGKYGEDSKLIYDLADQGGELLSLRYDLTVPFARFLAMNSVGNIKRFHIAKVYRRDQPQLSRGRYREFYQCDFDIAGVFHPMVADAEVITVATEILSSLPVGPFLIKLNHRVILDAIFEICGVPSEKFRPICSAVDKLDKEPWVAVRDEMVNEKGLSAEVADRIGLFVLQSGSPKELLAHFVAVKQFGEHAAANSALAELGLLFGYLEAMGSLQYVSFDMSLARGLDYYTGVIYEAVLTDGTSQVGSIAAGGRYDNLVGMFSASNAQTPCVGVSIGIERVFAIMEQRAKDQNLLGISNIQVFIASIGPNMFVERMKVARLLWNANIAAEYSHQENPKFKKQLDDCLERRIPFMVIFGKDETSKGTVKVKNVRDHNEVEVPLGQIISTLMGMGCAIIPAGADLSLLESA